MYRGAWPLGVGTLLTYRYDLISTQDSRLVPLTGLEPVWYCYRGILSPLCLPIPPQRHICATFLYTTFSYKKSLFAIRLSLIGARVGFVYASTSNESISHRLNVLSFLTLLFHIFVLLRVFLFGRPQEIWTPSLHYVPLLLPLSYRWTKLCYTQFNHCTDGQSTLVSLLIATRETRSCFLEFVHCSILRYGFILTTNKNYWLCFKQNLKHI